VGSRVQERPFDVGAELAALTAGHTDVGGVASFVGLVRGYSAAGPLVAMTLEHYPGMTERMLAEIEAEAGRRWPLLASLIVHRVGRLVPGEGIVLVAVAAAHRQAAFDACAFIMDWLKTDAPFWKLEESATGEARWVDAHTADSAAASRWGKSL
jgi:molybdopterin synthase catalytic subunit